MQISPSRSERSAGHRFAWPIGRILLGATLLLSAWMVSWYGPERISIHTFFPLWLGYIVLVDGIVEARSGSSLWTRNPIAFATLFVVSMPLWWLFEAANLRLQNWHYHVPASYGFPTLSVERSVAFSTVLPAVFETCELVHTTRFSRLGAQWRRFSLSPARLRWASVAGALMLLGTLLFPRELFPLIWISGFLILDPFNALLGRPSLFASASRGRWTPLLVLAIAALICGFFWELWNIRASAKWTYDIPYFDWLHIFEMPVFGYGGYIPFAFELYAAYHLISAILPRPSIARLAIDECGHDSRKRAQT